MHSAGLGAILRAVLSVSMSVLALVAPACGQDNAALGKQIFNEVAQPSCALCHTLKDAGAAGTVGPVLDELKPTADKVEQAVRSGVGVMPPYENLTDEQIEAVARYVSSATGAE